MPEPVRLTAFSHGAGCGCKIAPAVLSRILASPVCRPSHAQLLVGNDTRDDAAAWALDTSGGPDDRVVLSTTDFFMPIVDDPRDFGAIASVNAMSDVYAMGGQPTLAIAILGWPLDQLGPEVAAEVLEGARDACEAAGIPLAGGHSIDAPEPIFGLAVTGLATRGTLRTNAGAQPGDRLYLTKPLGIGLYATAQKRGVLDAADAAESRRAMRTLNAFGARCGQLEGVHAMTDVTGFGLLGHLVEMADGAGLTAELDVAAVPRLARVDHYLAEGTLPGGTHRNFASYGERVAPMTDAEKGLLCDPQTSGGLLVAVAPGAEATFREAAASAELLVDPLAAIGSLRARATADEPAVLLNRG